jgi:hypothetical protein
MFAGPEGRLWQQHTGRFGRPPDGSPVNFSVWENAQTRSWARPAGVVTVAGWSDSIGVPIKVNGRARKADGRSAVIASAPVQATGRLTDMAVRGELIDGSGGGANQVVRFLLPPGGSPKKALVATVPFGNASEFWDGRRWVSAGAGAEVGAVPGLGLGKAFPPSVDPGAPGRFGDSAVRVMPGPMGGGATEIEIPASAVVAGQVFVRVGLNGGVFTRTPTLRELA